MYRYQGEQMANALPKSLFKFYVKYAARGHLGILILWTLIQIWVNSGMVWFPMMQRWFVALFEQPADSVSGFIEYALPTVILIVMLEMSFTTGMTLRDFLSARWKPTIQNQISEELTDYVQHQSMSLCRRWFYADC